MTIPLSGIYDAFSVVGAGVVAFLVYLVLSPGNDRSNRNAAIANGRSTISRDAKRSARPSSEPSPFANTCIPGTSVPRSTPLGPNPLTPSLSYPRRKSGKNKGAPLAGILHPKLNKDGTPRTRAVKPGKMTPALSRPSRNPPIDSSPYQDSGSKLMMLPGRTSKYRHIADFSLHELRQIGWDGAKYNSATLGGQWVPFVCGYDSDPEDSYNRIDISVGKRAKTIGLHEEEKLFMELPGVGVGEISDPAPHHKRR